jgi:hypothetical protein
MSQAQSPAELLRRAKVRVDPTSYFLVGLRHEEWSRLLESPELSPTGHEPFMVLKDRDEVTLLLSEEDWRRMKHVARDARVEADFRLFTFDLELGWDTVGFLAEISRVLASAGVPIGALSAYSRDHLLIKQEHLPLALRTLSGLVDELC